MRRELDPAKLQTTPALHDTPGPLLPFRLDGMLRSGFTEPAVHHRRSINILNIEIAGKARRGRTG
ncbi:hypothetical protein GCM10011363_45110 [Marivita lacus]|uniref:Uncharacterized protein n=1 Tax=Marivita lacus TaxID=1323742 RepID=A0ABQ1LES0_9RHOB|nr:hypothetical protein GCM10011363_45110 [Marivita lacus]